MPQPKFQSPKPEDPRPEDPRGEPELLGDIIQRLDILIKLAEKFSPNPNPTAPGSLYSKPKTWDYEHENET